MKHRSRVMLVASFLSLAAAPFAAFAAADWTMFQKDPIGHGAQEGTGMVASTTTEIVNNVYGGNHQPLVADVDNDNENEVIVFSGNYLRILDKYLQIKGEKIVGALQSQPSLVQYDADAYREIAGIVNRNSQNYFTVWKYTGGINGFTVMQEAALTPTDVGAVKCVEFDNELTAEECVFKGSSGAVSIYNRNGLIQRVNISAGSGPDANLFVPAFYDVNGDRRMDGAFMHNNILTLLDITGTTTVKDLGQDFRFPISGRWDVTFTTSRPTVILAAQFNHGGCSLPLSSIDCKSYLLSYLPNGQLQWAQVYFHTSNCWNVESCNVAPRLAYPRVTKISGNETVTIAAHWRDHYGGNSRTRILKYNANGSFINESVAPGWWDFDVVSFANFTNDGDPEFITKQGIYAPNGAQVAPLTLAGSPVAADVDRDGSLDIVMTTPGKTKIVYFHEVVPPSRPPLASNDPPHEWRQFQRDERGSAFQPGSGFFSTTTPAARFTAQAGSSFQPLAGDLDADGRTEIVIVDGGNVSVYDRTMQRQATIPLGTIVSQPALVQYDTDPRLEIAGIVEGGQERFYGVLEYDGASIGPQQIIRISSQARPSHIRCADLDGDRDTDCFYKDANGIVHGYDTAGNHFTTDVSGGTGSDTKPFAPSFDDVDRDDVLDAAFVHNNKLTVIDRNGMKWQKDIGGYFLGPSRVEVTFADLDGGHKEVIAVIQNAAISQYNTTPSYVVALQSNGDALWAHGFYYTTQGGPPNWYRYFHAPPLNNVLVNDFDSDGFDEIGVMSVQGEYNIGGDGTGVTVNYLDYDGRVLFTGIAFNQYILGGITNMFVGATFADMNGDGKTDWITGNRMFSHRGDIIYPIGNAAPPIPLNLGFGCLSLVSSKPGESAVLFLPWCILE